MFLEPLGSDALADSEKCPVIPKNTALNSSVFAVYLIRTYCAATDVNCSVIITVHERNPIDG